MRRRSSRRSPSPSCSWSSPQAAWHRLTRSSVRACAPPGRPTCRRRGRCPGGRPSGAQPWAFAHRPIAGSLDRLPADELRAARASGAGVLTAARTVALRPLAPALVAAWLICFLTALHEVTMSSLLYGPGSETLAVVVLNTQELGRIGPTAALSVLLSLLVGIPA